MDILILEKKSPEILLKAAPSLLVWGGDLGEWSSHRIQAGGMKESNHNQPLSFLSLPLILCE